MDFSYRFNKSAVAKRIIATHGDGVEAIFEEDYEYDKTVMTMHSNEFDKNSLKTIRERTDYSALMRSQEEPMLSIVKNGSDTKLQIKDSKEALNIRKASTPIKQANIPIQN